MRRAMIWCVAPLMLAGCASGVSPAQNAENAQNAVYSRFVGRPIEDAVALYGMPDGQMEVQGHKVYVWRHQKSMSFNRPQEVVSRGRIGHSWDPNSVPYTQVSTVYGRETLDLQCVLSIGTEISRPGIIDSTALNGKMGACQDFVP